MGLLSLNEGQGGTTGGGGGGLTAVQVQALIEQYLDNELIAKLADLQERGGNPPLVPPTNDPSTSQLVDVVTAHADEIDKLNGDVATVQATADQNASDIQQLQSDASTLSGTVGTLQSDVQTAQTTAADADGKASSALGQLATLSGQVAALGVSEQFRLHGQALSGTEQGGLTGYSVSLSADGTRMAVGEREVGKGSRVRVYSNLKGLWTPVGGDLQDATEDSYSGTSVAMSGDGKTVAIGSPEMNTVQVYEELSEGVWTRTFAYTDPNIPPPSMFGKTVALSQDGTVLVVGAPESTHFSIPDQGNLINGLLRVFRKDSLLGNVWPANNTGGVLIAGADGEQLSVSVALSADGNTLAAGGAAYENEKGRLNIYRYENDAWTTPIRVDGTAAGGRFGYAVSVSPDGSFVACSGPNDVGQLGQTVVVDASGESVVLAVTAPVGSEDFGSSLALTNSLLVVGSPDDTSGDGKVYVYAFQGDDPATPVQVLEPKLDVNDVEDDVSMFGFDVSMSADGLVLAVGAPEHQQMTGRVRVYRKAAFAVNQEQAFERVLTYDLDATRLTSESLTSTSVTSTSVTSGTVTTTDLALSDRVRVTTLEADLAPGSSGQLLTSHDAALVRSVKYLLTSQTQITELAALHNDATVALSRTNTAFGETLAFDCAVALEEYGEEGGQQLRLRVTNNLAGTIQHLTLVATATNK